MKRNFIIALALIGAIVLITANGCGVSKSKYDELSKENTALQEKLALALSEKDAFKAEHDKILNEKIALKTSYDTLFSEKLALKGEYDKLLQEKVQLSIQADTLTSEKNKLQEELNKYTAKKKKSNKYKIKERSHNMSKFLTSFAVLFLVALVVMGCGKKEAANESMDMTMPMSVSVDSGTTNMITKEGVPVQTSPSPADAVMMETPAAAVGETANYVAPSVQDIQTALKNAGLYLGAIDGKLGPGSKRAITEFQQQNGLTADGKVGRKTWEKLKVHLNQSQQ